jgi:hypothetical protein
VCALPPLATLLLATSAMFSPTGTSPVCSASRRMTGPSDLAPAPTAEARLEAALVALAGALAVAAKGLARVVAAEARVEKAAGRVSHPARRPASLLE